MSRILFPLGLFLSAALLFVIQPIVAKVLLPVYGGTPAVWTVCMLFFQVLLLVAYGYVWVLSRFPGVATWRFVHLGVCLLSLGMWPLAFHPTSGPVSPDFWIFKNLIVQLGLPLLVVAATAPLLQYAFSQTKGKQAEDPFFLYAASNVGSLLALLSYPWLIERFSGVNLQFYGWNLVYFVYVLVLFGLLLFVKYYPLDKVSVAEKVCLKKKFAWIFLSFVPCSLMLGVTLYISTDVAATPVFWVVPLALYLLSYVLTFAKKPVPHAIVCRFVFIFWMLPCCCLLIGANQIPALVLIVSNLAGFFMLALLCHGELVRTRPKAKELTTFYFCLALGGVSAGIFNGILAPRIFTHTYEYPFVLLMALLCMPNVRAFKRRTMFIFITVIAIALCILPKFRHEHVLSQQRNFYGVKQVFSRGGAHVLMSQNTLHGFQVLSDKNPTDGARAYYGSVLPVVEAIQSKHPSVRAMILGLGTGILACQFRATDELTMVEIDEQVIRIASDPQLFTYLRDCPPDTKLIENDGLKALELAHDATYDVLVMDAFHSDAIPVHLLTLEAFGVYQKKLAPDGVILVNMTNRHIRVLPVLAAAGQELQMIVLHNKQSLNPRLGQLGSEWALLTTNERLASQLMGRGGWRFVTDIETRLWTNDYSNVIPLLRFWNDV